MDTFDNIMIIGTSHIAIESVREVERVIMDVKPKIIALELDHRRFLGLIRGKRTKWTLKGIRQLGVKGFIWNMVGAWIEKRLGKLVGMKPGAEMKKAIASAQKVKGDIALIDQDIALTLRKLTKEITWKEKWRFAKDIIKSVIYKHEKVKIDLTKVPDQAMIKKLTHQVKKRYPSLYKILIDERNVFMAKALYKLKHQYPSEKIVAVIGAGHTEGTLKLLQQYEKTK